MTTAPPRRLILARLRLLPTAERARRASRASIYRPHWNIGNTSDGEPALDDARVFLEDGELLSPGEERAVYIEPLFPEQWTHVTPGMQLPMHEGHRVLGVATVLEVIDVE